MKVLRCNLSKKNDFYATGAPPKVTGKEPIDAAALEDAPYIAPASSTSTPSATPSPSPSVRLCLVCGLPAGSKQCGGGCAGSSIGAQPYCGAAHQRAHWRAGHKDECKLAIENKAAAAAVTPSPATPAVETKTVAASPAVSSSSTTTATTNTIDLAVGILPSAKVVAMKTEIWNEQWIDIEEEDWDSDGENEMERKMIDAYRKEEAAMSKQEKDAEGNDTDLMWHICVLS